MSDPRFNGKDRSMEQIVGHRVSQSHGVARVLALERDTWCAIWLYRLAHFIALKHKEQPPPSHETRSAEGVQDLGPQYCRDDQDRPSRGTRGARLGYVATSPFVALKHKEQPPPSRETRSAEGVQDPGPQYCRDDQDRPSRGTHVARD
jgi:hypothetical protein